MGYTSSVGTKRGEEACKKKNARSNTHEDNERQQGCTVNIYVDNWRRRDAHSPYTGTTSNINDTFSTYMDTMSDIS